MRSEELAKLAQPAQTGAVDSYRVDLPPGWVTMAVDGTEIREAVAAARADDVANWDSLTKAEQRRAELFVEQFISDLGEACVSFAGIYREVADEEPQWPDEKTAAIAAEAAAAVPDLDRLLAASLVVASFQPGITETTAPIDADLLLSALSLQQPSEEERAQLGIDLEPPQIVTLPAGRCVRAVRLIERNLPRSDASKLPSVFKIFTVLYFVPVPDDTRSVLLAQFATPNIGDARAFAEVFAAIAGTLRFYAEGERTTL